MSGRSFIIQGVIVLIALVFSIRLFSIQVLDDEYKLAAQNNILQKIVDYPFRGLIYDRDGNLLVYNTPVYDLMIVPKEVDLNDSAEIMNLLEIDHATFESKYEKARRYSSILASKFMEQIPNDMFARIQDRLVNYNGFYPLPRTVRGYEKNILANTLGYIGEVDRRELNRDTTNYYKSGDYIGKIGIEKQYEDKLRGKRGIRYKIVNVQGVVKGEFRDGEYDTASVPGQSIQLTIDTELQTYAEKLLKGKVAGLVALDPKTGEIIAMVSSPSYDPNLLSGRDIGKNFSKIQDDSLKPLFNRPLQAMYPPGSMFKTIQALIAMQEKKLYPNEKIMCEGNLIGDHAPPGIYDVERAIKLSSNNYFYKVFKRVIEQGDHENRYIDARIGMEKWNDYIYKFGLGHKLGVDIPNENNGFIPDISYYDKVYKGANTWAFSNIYSLSIGQGELLVTPLQMANLGALLANRGHYYTPHIVKSIDGQGLIEPQRNDVGIDDQYFPPVIDGMEQVVRENAFRAYIPDLPICGKTSTVENPHGMDHSGFMAFAPKDDPQIAIAVYVENAGWGARAAASTASLVIEKYIKGEISRPWVEEFVLKGDFLDERQKRELEAMNKAKRATQP
ncbi:penicillin-binding protein 2 [Marinoscillum sp.]|uniref:penicillin-binding protein 2 n=1 Tax=Marinoscillum sp. TaxID=2024838 RepID=UPI003BAD4252